MLRILLLLLAVLPAVSVAQTRVPETPTEIQLGFAPVVQQAAPAVVNIYARRVVNVRSSPFAGDPFFDNLFRDFGAPRQRVQNSLGSGVILLAAAEGETRLAPPPPVANQRLYSQESPLEGMSFGAKVDLLREIDDYLRARDPRVAQVSATLAGSLQEVTILRPEGGILSEARPMARLNISVIVEQDGRRETGSTGGGGRRSWWRRSRSRPPRWKAPSPRFRAAMCSGRCCRGS